MWVAVFVVLATLASIPGWSAPELQKPQGKECIRPTDWMRRNHMDFLKDRREDTVRQAVRLPKESLLTCQTCHQSREKFCDRCHDYVGVKPDCFECHVYP
ncbi:MAG: Hdr-like menaquinol oxidoreductase cytochrome c subunit [Magnetococcales bacterium]|nr:Hdr-like menaquinol oxidoreductase cytochrome c subunit [Magnetococcales bacterium]